LADDRPMPDRLDVLLKTMGADGSWPVFLRENGRRLTRQWSNRRFRKCRERAGLDAKYGPHSLRHTYATELLETGSDIRVVQECLRHTSIRTTERYTLVRKGPKALAVRRLHFGVTVTMQERKEDPYAVAGVEEAAKPA
jgi:integrase/recombinase XerD